MLSRGGDSGNAIVVVGPPLPPRPARQGSYSAGEIRGAVRMLRAWQRSNPGVANPGPGDGWPSGYVAGFKAFVERDDKARAGLAGNHPKRLELLHRFEDLPYTLHEDLYRLARMSPEELLTAASDSFSCEIEVRSYESGHVAVTAELKAMLRLLKILTLLALTSKRKYPTVLLLALCWVLTAQWTAPTSAESAPNAPPPRVTRPPGRFTLAEPRVTRAPGLHGSLALIAARAASGRVRLGEAL